MRKKSFLLIAAAILFCFSSCSTGRNVIPGVSRQELIVSDSHRAWYIGDEFDSSRFEVYLSDFSDGMMILDNSELTFSMKDGEAIDETHERIYITYKGLSVPYDIYASKKIVSVLDYLVMTRASVSETVLTEKQVEEGDYSFDSLAVNVIFSDGSIVRNPEDMNLEAVIDGESGYYNIVASLNGKYKKILERHGLTYEGDGTAVNTKDNVRVYRNGDNLTVYFDDILSTRVKQVEIMQNGMSENYEVPQGAVGGVLKFTLRNAIIDGGYDWKISLMLDDGEVRSAEGFCETTDLGVLYE